VLEIDLVIYEFQYEFFGIVRDRRNIREYLLEILIHEAAIGILLNLYQIRHVEDFIDPGKAHACLFTHLHFMHHRVLSSLDSAAYKHGLYLVAPPLVIISI
jgi:hypothetical protein